MQQKEQEATGRSENGCRRPLPTRDSRRSKEMNEQLQAARTSLNTLRICGRRDTRYTVELRSYRRAICAALTCTDRPRRRHMACTNRSRRPPRSTASASAPVTNRRGRVGRRFPIPRWRVPKNLYHGICTRWGTVQWGAHLVQRHGRDDHGDDCHHERGPRGRHL